MTRIFLALHPCSESISSRIQRGSRLSLLFLGSQPGPSRGLSLMSSQGSVDSDHLGKLGWSREDQAYGKWTQGCIVKGLGKSISRD